MMRWPAFHDDTIVQRWLGVIQRWSPLTGRWNSVTNYLTMIDQYGWLGSIRTSSHNPSISGTPQRRFVASAPGRSRSVLCGSWRYHSNGSQWNPEVIKSKSDFFVIVLLIELPRFSKIVFGLSAQGAFKADTRQSQVINQGMLVDTKQQAVTKQAN